MVFTPCQGTQWGSKAQLPCPRSPWLWGTEEGVQRGWTGPYLLVDCQQSLLWLHSFRVHGAPATVGEGSDLPHAARGGDGRVRVTQGLEPGCRAALVPATTSSLPLAPSSAPQSSLRSCPGRLRCLGYPPHLPSTAMSSWGSIVYWASSTQCTSSRAREGLFQGWSLSPFGDEVQFLPLGIPQSSRHKPPGAPI